MSEEPPAPQAPDAPEAPPVPTPEAPAPASPAPAETAPAAPAPAEPAVPALPAAAAPAPALPAPAPASVPEGAPKKGEILLFGKWSFEAIQVKDPGLIRYINVKPIAVPHTSGRHANKSFAKQRLNIVERLINGMMRSEHSTG